MDLKGAASSHNMYLYGGDPLTVPIESLLPPLITSQPQPTGMKASTFISSSGTSTSGMMDVIYMSNYANRSMLTTCATCIPIIFHHQNHVWKLAHLLDKVRVNLTKSKRCWCIKTVGQEPELCCYCVKETGLL